jgi:hypothetical protein
MLIFVREFFFALRLAQASISSWVRHCMYLDVFQLIGSLSFLLSLR